MSIRFFITPFDPQAWEDPDDTRPKPTSDLHLDPADYLTKLKERWPALTLSSTLPNGWTLPPEKGEDFGLEVHLQANQQIVSFGIASKQNFVNFILWHRAYVPAHYPLYLFNSSSYDRLLLTPNTAEADIIEFFGLTE